MSYQAEINRRVFHFDQVYNLTVHQRAAFVKIYSNTTVGYWVGVKCVHRTRLPIDLAGAPAIIAAYFDGTIVVDKIELRNLTGYNRMQEIISRLNRVARKVSGSDTAKQLWRRHPLCVEARQFGDQENFFSHLIKMSTM